MVAKMFTSFVIILTMFTSVHMYYSIVINDMEVIMKDIIKTFIIIIITRRFIKTR